MTRRFAPAAGRHRARLRHQGRPRHNPPIKPASTSRSRPPAGTKPVDKMAYALLGIFLGGSAYITSTQVRRAQASSPSCSAGPSFPRSSVSSRASSRFARPPTPMETSTCRTSPRTSTNGADIAFMRPAPDARQAPGASRLYFGPVRDLHAPARGPEQRKSHEQRG